MTSWAERMHRRATTLGSVVTSCGHGSGPYPHRLEKVKFGVPLDEVCKNDIPGPLLVLILKLNKEAPYKKDVFRAPGHQGNMKKLIHFLQTGRLVNMDNFSVYTIASVLKKFLRKLPGGIFGREGEQRLFTVIDMGNKEEQRDEIHRRFGELFTAKLAVAATASGDATRTDSPLSLLHRDCQSQDVHQSLPKMGPASCQPKSSLALSSRERNWCHYARI